MDADDEVLAVADRWRAAIVANDAEAIGAFVTDDWVLVDHDGIGSRESFLALVASGALTHDAMEMVEGTARVRRYGDTAVLTAQVTNTARFGGQVFPADEWTSDVFIRTADGWKCVLSHITAAAEHA